MIGLVNQFGLAGYGAFWMIVELLASEPDYSLRVDDLEPFLISIGWPNDDEEFKDGLANGGLLAPYSDHEGVARIHCPALTKRMEELERWREKLSKAGKKGAEKRWSKSNGQAIAVLPKPPNSSKRREEKSNNNNGEPPGYRKGTKAYCEYVWLTETEFEKLEYEYGTNMVMNKISDLAMLIAANEKTKGGKKYTSYKNHNLTIDKWCKKEEREHVDTHEILDDF
jgi:hypothetical protein